VDRPPFPDTRISGDSELDACLDFLLLYSSDRGVEDLIAITGVPVHAKGVLIEDAGRYFISTGVVDRLGFIPSTAVGGEAVAALIEIGGGEAMGRWDIVAGVDQWDQVDGGYTIPRSVRRGLRGGGWGRKKSSHWWGGPVAYGNSLRPGKGWIKEVLGYWWGRNKIDRCGLRPIRD
jgi:hypothetical protein